jgi:hypothetical protein
MMTKAAITAQVLKASTFVSGHALACLDCSFDDPFVVPFRHQGLFFAAPTGAFPGINAIAVRSFLRVRLRYAERLRPPRWRNGQP